MKDPKALYSIGYGLYALTMKDGEKNTGLIVNTVCQVTAEPERVAVTVNKQNYSHGLIIKNGSFAVCCLTVDTKMSMIERFGFATGKDKDKFEGLEAKYTSEGLPYFEESVNAVISLKVISSLDLGTHTMFICDVTEAFTLSDRESLTYSYYHKNIKPGKPRTGNGYVCKICGYVYEGDVLPADFICPICKHTAMDFEPLEEKREDSEDIYVCGACGYEHKGKPDADFSCPVCGVDATLFFKL